MPAQGDRGKGFPVVGPDLGYISGTPNEVVPDRGWVSVTGARFYMGNCEKIPGWVKVQASGLADQVMGLYSFDRNDGVSFWIAVTKTKIYKLAAADTTFQDITDVALTGGAESWADFTVWTPSSGTSILIITNGSDTPRSWDGNAATVSKITNAPNAMRVTVFQNHVLFTDINPFSATPSHQTIQWSDLGSYTVYTGGESGTLTFPDEPSNLLTSVPLRDALICYKPDAAYVVTYTGTPFTMSSQRLMTGSGPISARCVINVRDLHYYLGNDRECYRLSFFGPEPIGQSVREGLFGELNWANVAHAHAVLNQTGSEIFFYIPTGNDTWPTVCYVLRYREDKWGREANLNPVTCAAQRGVSLLNQTVWSSVTTAWSAQGSSTWASQTYAKGSKIVLHAEATTFYVMEHTAGNYDADTVARTFQVDSKAFDFGDPDSYKRLQRVNLSYVVTGATLSLYVLTADGPDSTQTTNGPYTFVMDGNSNQQFIPVDLTAKYFTFRFYNNTLGANIKITGYEPVLYPRGVI